MDHSFKAYEILLTFEEHEAMYVVYTYILYGNVFVGEELQSGRRTNISMSNKFNDV